MPLLCVFLGDPNADPPTNGTLQDTRSLELQLIFPPVPTGSVIEVNSRRMWATNYPKTSAGRGGGPEAWTQTPTGHLPEPNYFFFKVDTGAVLSSPSVVGAAGRHYN